MRPEQQRLTDAFQQVRTSAGITQDDIAEHTGRHQTTVSKWLTGKTVPPLDVLPVVEVLAGRPRGYILRLAGLVEEDVDVLGAIATDPQLDDEGRAVVTFVYRYCRDRHQPTTAAVDREEMRAWLQADRARREAADVEAS